MTQRFFKKTGENYIEFFLDYWLKMPYKKKLIIILILVIIFSFYWYEYRPSHVRVLCDEYTKEYFHGNDYYRDSETWNRVFNSCLGSRGIEK
jgi:hypothetical protein